MDGSFQIYANQNMNDRKKLTAIGLTYLELLAIGLTILSYLPNTSTNQSTAKDLPTNNQMQCRDMLMKIVNTSE